MKRLLLRYALILLTIAISSTACNNRPAPQQIQLTIDSHVVCTYDEQSVAIKYSARSGQGPVSARITATSSAEWISSIDCSDARQIVVNVEANEGELRTAEIELSASGVAPFKIEISQIAPPADVAEHALVFYFFGTSLSRFFDDNIEDVSTAIGEGVLGNNNRVIIYRQRVNSEAYIRELCYDPIHRGVVERRIKDKIDVSLEDMTAEDIASTIDEITSYVPAKRYGMVLAGHGHGWVTRDILNNDEDVIPFALGYGGIWTPHPDAEVTRSFGERNVQVDIATLAEGITSSSTKFDYLLFDACFMSNIEAIYELRDAANYIIASPCEIMGRGFPYHRTLPYLFADGGAQSDVIGAAESYYLYYRDEYIGAARCGSVAVYDCREVENLARATALLMYNAADEYDASTLQTYEGHVDHIFYDFGQYCSVVAAEGDFDAFERQLDATVIAKFTLPTFYSAYGYSTYPIDVEAYSGVTTSAPCSIYAEEWRETLWYQRVYQ